MLPGRDLPQRGQQRPRSWGPYDRDRVPPRMLDGSHVVYEEVTEVALFQRVMTLNEQEAQQRLVQEELALQGISSQLRQEQAVLQEYGQRQQERDEQFQTMLQRVRARVVDEANQVARLGAQVTLSEDAVSHEGQVLLSYQQRLQSEGLELQRASLGMTEARDRLEIAEVSAQARYDLAEGDLRRSRERLHHEESNSIHANLRAAEELAEV